MTLKNEEELVSAAAACKIMHMGYIGFIKKVHSGELKLKFIRRGPGYLFYKKEVEEAFKNSFQTIEERN